MLSFFRKLSSVQMCSLYLVLGPKDPGRCCRAVVVMHLVMQVNEAVT